jgi:hypothetical protein
MNYLGVAGDYAVWWYSGGLIRLVRWISALFGWTSNYFSVGRVFKTFFSPWKRLVETRQPGIDGLKDWFLDNLISRLVGFFMRLTIIIVYLLTMVSLAVFAVLALGLWVGLPLIVIFSFFRIFI